MNDIESTATEKVHVDNHNETLQDHEIVGGKDGSKEEAMHWGALTEEELVIEKKLRKKIDILIMPLIMLIYLMNYIDRNNYAAARLQGLPEDIGLEPDSSEYQVGLSILFVGYVLMQVPSNLLLNYMGRPSLYLGGFTVAWGLVSTLTSQVTNYGGIVAARFILGVVEAPFFAGTLFYLSKWYSKKELSFRMALFYSASLVSGAFGNLIAAGILDGMAGELGYSAWQWLYIIEGSITMFIGVVVMIVLPDFPDSWRALSPEMKRVANRRLAIDAAEADVDEAGGMSQLRGAKAAFMDPKTYLLAIAYHGITGAAGFQNFFPTLTRELYDDDTISLLLVAPPYVFMVFYSLGHSWASDRFQMRFWFFVYPIPVTILGCLLYMFVDNFGGRYVSFFFLNFVFAMNATCYAWISNSIPRPPAKRAAALAFINSVGNAASIWTPFTYTDSSAPHYRPALGVVIGLMAVAGICAVILRLLLQYQNRQLERLENSDATLTDKDMAKLRKTAEFEDIDIATARQLQKGYRYMI